MIALAALACVEPDGPPFLLLRGEIEPEIRIDGDDAIAMLAWVTAVDGELCFESVEVPFSPYLLQYEVAIEGPPPLQGDTCVVAPEGLGDVRAAWGALLLTDPEPRRTTVIEADPSALLEWFSGEQAELAPLVLAQDGVIVALASRFSLMVSSGEPPTGDRFCRFDQILEGLAPYIDRGSDCGGWDPIAEPGTLTEVQGVDLEPAP